MSLFSKFMPDRKQPFKMRRNAEGELEPEGVKATKRGITHRYVGEPGQGGETRKVLRRQLRREIIRQKQAA